MSRTQNRTFRAATVLVIAALTFLAVLTFLAASGHGASALSTAHATGSCPPETSSCVQLPFPCAATCSASVGPVTNLGQNQSVYVQLDGIPLGDQVAVAICALGPGGQVGTQPQCASLIPPAPGCTVPITGGPCPATASPLEWQFGYVSSDQTTLSVATEYDPDIPGAEPIVSQTADQLVQGDTYGSFFCDNAASPCGILVVDIPPAQSAAVEANGFPLLPSDPVTPENSVVLPLNWASSGNGCGSAPVIQADASYSVAQFLPAAGEATCTGPAGVAVIPTAEPSVDDPSCATGSGSHCPIADVIDGAVPVTFTDDPEDPATLAEEQKAGGKFAYIPIAVSATEFAFEGGAGVSASGSSATIPLSNYRLTPAEAAGIMTQFWNGPLAGPNQPNDDVCGQLSGKAQCTETMDTAPQTLLVNTINGQYANIDVSNAFGGKPKNITFTTFGYHGGYVQQGPPGTKKNYSGDTAYYLLNPWPLTISGFPVNEGHLGAIFPSTASGSIYEATGWMCAAPNVGFTATLPFGGQATVKDLLGGQQILADAEQGPLTVSKGAGGYVVSATVNQQILANASECQAISTLPTDFGTSAQAAADQYNPSSQPLTAAHTISGALGVYGGNGGFAFTAMDSSEADFYGLLPASLQNAAGSFVEPTSSAIEAALNDATTNSDGTLNPNYGDTSDAAAYPLPMVTYALVSTGPQPSEQQASELKDLLTNLVDYSHSGGANTGEPLPSGYVPLPDDLSQQALTDISKDIVGPNGSSSNGSSSSGPGTGGSTSTGAASGSANGAGATTGAGRAGGPPLGRGAHAGAPLSSALAAGAGGAGSSSGTFAGRLITVTVGDSRYFVPGLLLLALLCLLVGPLLYLYPSLRKAPGPSGSGGSEHEQGASSSTVDG